MTSNMIDLEKIDLEQLNETKQILKARFPSLAKDFIDDSESYICQIESAVVALDLNEIVQNAHPLKSSSGSFGLLGLSQIAGDIEKIAKNGLADSAIKDVFELLPKLKSSFGFAKKTLEQLIES